MKTVMTRALGVFVAAAIFISGARPVAAEGPAESLAGDLAAARTIRGFGAIGDGRADDTAAIEKAVAAGGAVRIGRGVYRVTRPIVVALDKVGPVSFLGDGTGRIVMAGPGPALRLVGTHQGTADPASVKPGVWQHERTPMVDGLEIVGDDPQAGGIEADGTVQLTVTRTVIRNVVHAVHFVRRNRNAIIANCHLYENRGAGIFFDDVNQHQTNVTGCHISYNAGGGVVARGGDVRNVHLTGCDIEANMAPDAPATANVLVDCAGGRAGTAGTAEIAITGCTIQHSDNCPESANIRYLGSDAKDRRWGHLTITGNVLSDVQWNIDLRKARGVTIVGNTFWMGFAGDLRAEECSNVVVGANNFDRNPAYAYGRSLQARGGVVFRNCRDCSLVGLHVSGVQGTAAGLVLEKCRRMLVANATILDCENAGLLADQLADSRVTGCLIRSDLARTKPWVAIKVVGGQGNVIERSAGK